MCESEEQRQRVRLLYEERGYVFTALTPHEPEAEGAPGGASPAVPAATAPIVATCAPVTPTAAPAPPPAATPLAALTPSGSAAAPGGLAFLA